MVVIGDHGMTETGFKFTTMHNTIFQKRKLILFPKKGDHGGDSKLELESALFFYSKKNIQNSIHKTQKVQFSFNQLY